MAFLYAVFAGLWILSSGYFLSYTVDDPDTQQLVELGKGLLFVIVTSLLLYTILRLRSPKPGSNARARPQSDKGIVAVITGLLLVVPFAGFAVIRIAQPVQEGLAYASLEAIAELQSEGIRIWRDERFNDINALTRSRSFIEQVAALQSGDAAGARSLLHDRMDVVREAYRYHCVLLVDREGELLLAVGRHPALHAETLNLLARVRTGGQPAQSTMYLDAQDSPNIDFIAPVTTAGGDTIAYVITRSAPGDFVLENLGDLPLPAGSLETLLVRPAPDGATVFHLTRQSADEPRLLPSLPGRDTLIDTIASGSDSGRLAGTDHHGHSVLAIHRQEPGTGWQLVSKVDRDDALAPLRALALWVSVVVFAAMAVIATVLIMLWRQQQRAHQLSLLAAGADHERQLRRQQAVYREMFDANPHPMWVYDRDSLRFLAVNNAALDRYGYSRDEFLAMTIEQVHPEEDLLRFRTLLATPQGQGIDRSGLWRHRKKDGTLIDVEISSHPILFDNREAKLVLAYDMTERNRLLNLLKESDRFAHATLDALPLRIAVLDETGTVIATNRLWRDFNAENPDDATAMEPGGNYLEMCRRTADINSDSAALLAGLQQVIDGEITRFTHEYPYHAGGEHHWFLVHITRFDGDGPLRIVVARELVTQRKQVELALRKLNRYYAALSRMNTTIIRSRNADEILEQVCRIAAEQGELALVCAYRRQPDGTLTSVAASGEALDYLSCTQAAAEAEASQGPIDEALRSGRAAVCHNLEEIGPSDWSQRASERGFRAIAACPIVRNTGTWGCLVFYALEAQFFTPDLLALLDELTADLAYSLDILDLEQARAEAQRELLLNARILESSHEGLLITDEHHRITMANRALCDITGHSRQELLGNHLQLLADGRQDASFFDDIDTVLRDCGRWEGEILQQRKNGEPFPAWLTITRVCHDQDQTCHNIVIYRDITERKEYEQKIEHIASHDILTDLPNRVLLDDRIALAIARAKRQDQRLALLFIDLDGFKLVNDTLGHETGDQLLRQVSRRIVGVLRDSDTVSRVGGDEFIALLTDIHQREDAALVADKITTAIGQPCQVAGRQLVVTASVGIALYPDHGQDVAGLTRLADTAMLSAKQSGHNRYQFYSGELGARAVEYLDIQNELRGAVGRGELFLAYQPQCLIDNGRVIGVEALARWRHPRLGLVSPAQFIPVAENSGLIVEIGTWVLGEACRQTAEWRERGLIDTRVSVNVSALQFRQPDFVDRVNASLRETGLPAAHLELEVTESLLMHNNEQSRDKLRQLYHSGVRLAIDDFGTGYSSLSYLRHFPAQRLKIDKSFINDLPDSPDAASIARAIISLGLTMGMEVIAEGVETRKQADFLRRIRCQQAQGYLYSPPLPAEDFESWLLEWEKIHS